MFFQRIAAIARTIRGLSIDRELAHLLPPETMRMLLARERVRADRAGSSLSVVAFAANDGLTLVHFANVLQQRLRGTDLAGWLADRQLCAVLPDTPADGAWKVVDDICRSLPDNIAAPDCTVYSYPSGQGDGVEGDQQAALPLSDSISGPGEEIAAAPEEGILSPPPGRPTRALEALLVRPLPLWKRSLDVLGAAVGLMLFAPLLAIIAVAIKVTSPGPVLFRQRRTGRGGRPFTIFKFRTMSVDAEQRKAALRSQNEQDGPAFKIKRDPRVTRLGRILRTTSLDELPQLWNVLRGDMSLVGPRPLPCDESQACSRWQRQRLDVTPGLTCIWQVRGRGRVTFAEWVRMDLRYIRSHSFMLDLLLLMLTLPAVLLRRGAH
jgi:lipopolysaccharide/colanic/teichoic acid biosynthesis glycosyltransferase